MEDAHGDPEDWLVNSQGPLERGLARLDESLRCPVCGDYLNTAITVNCPMGHSFCSQCLHRFHEKNPHECPACKGNRAAIKNGTTPSGIVRFEPARALDAVVRNYQAVVRPLKKLVLTRDAHGANHVGDESTGVMAASDDASTASSASVPALGEDAGLANVPWTRGAIRTLNYHMASDEAIRADLRRMGMNTTGSKEKLIFRHKEVRVQALEDLDRIKVGRPARSKDEIMRAVGDKERCREEDSKRKSVMDKLTTKNGQVRLTKKVEKGFKELIAKARQAQRDKSSGSSTPSAPAASEEEGELSDAAVQQREGNVGNGELGSGAFADGRDSEAGGETGALMEQPRAVEGDVVAGESRAAEFGGSVVVASAGVVHEELASASTSSMTTSRISHTDAFVTEMEVVDDASSAPDAPFPHGDAAEHGSTDDEVQVVCTSEPPRRRTPSPTGGSIPPQPPPSSQAERFRQHFAGGSGTNPSGGSKRPSPIGAEAPIEGRSSLTSGERQSTVLECMGRKRRSVSTEESRWQCPVCTYVNARSQKACEVCTTPYNSGSADEVREAQKRLFDSVCARGVD